MTLTTERKLFSVQYDQHINLNYRSPFTLFLVWKWCKLHVTN